MRLRFLSALALAVAVSASCGDLPPDPMQLNGNMLTVDNREKTDWKSVEIWVNQYFRVTVPTIAAGSRFQVPLNSFVSGYAQRFDANRLPIREIKLTAKRPDGTAVEIVHGAKPVGLDALGKGEGAGGEKGRE